jgi:hypothetical protein
MKTFCMSLSVLIVTIMFHGFGPFTWLTFVLFLVVCFILIRDKAVDLLLSSSFYGRVRKERKEKLCSNSRKKRKFAGII